MSAVSLFVGKSAAYLISDGASFLPDGTVEEICSKVLVSNRLQVTAAASGRACIRADETGRRDYPGDDVQRLLERCESASEFLAQLPILLRSLPITREEGFGCFQLSIGLWNAAERRPEGYVIGTEGHTFAGLEPLTLARISESVMPAVDRSLWPAGEDLTRAEALAIVEEQRRSRELPVAGFAELTTVSERGVSTERLVTWPDRVGRKVDPKGPGGYWRRLLSRAVA